MNVLIILVGIFAISVLFVGGTQGMYILLGLFINLGIFFPIIIRLSSEVADIGIVDYRVPIDRCGYLIFYQWL